MSRFEHRPQEVRASRKGDAERNRAPLADFYAEEAVVSKADEAVGL
jgi:hypothetical protein